MQPDHPLIGDVRGKALIVGTELVSDHAIREPATRDTARLVHRCFEPGLIVIYSGAHRNVIEMTPPLTISERELDEGLALFEEALCDVVADRFDDPKLAPYGGC
jgi:4-aminobutyrate aminotransferase